MEIFQWDERQEKRRDAIMHEVMDTSISESQTQIRTEIAFWIVQAALTHAIQCDGDSDCPSILLGYSLSRDMCRRKLSVPKKKSEGRSVDINGRPGALVQIPFSPPSLPHLQPPSPCRHSLA